MKYLAGVLAVAAGHEVEMDTIVYAYNGSFLVLLVAVVTACAIALYSAVLLCIHWGTEHRKRHAKRMGVAIVAIPCLIGIQQAIVWWVFMPAMGRHQMAEIAAHRAENNANSSLVQVGETAPNFSITDVDGVKLKLDDARGDVVVINFFATWCGPCKLELPHIDSIWSDHRDDKNFRLLVIGREETDESVRTYRSQNAYSFPIAADPDRAVYSQFAKELIPRTIVIAPDGKVVYSQSGFDENDLGQLRDVIDKQLEGAAVARAGK